MANGIETMEDALLALSNFDKELEDYSERANPNFKGREGLTGAAGRFLEIVQEWREKAGDEATAAALEKTRGRMNLTYLALYYDARQGSEVEEMQDQSEAEFDFWMNEFIFELLEEPEEAEEDTYGPEDEGETYQPFEEEIGTAKPEPEPPKMSKKELEAAYRRVRKELQKLISRRKKAGVDVKIEVPDKPKKITAGSIRRLEGLKAKVKSDYRYLVGRGYRGGTKK